MSKTIELIYSQQATDFMEGRAYSNPRFFSSPRSGVSKVFLVGDWPDIREAYEAIGVPVERLDADAAVAPPPESAQPPAGLVDQITAAFPADPLDHDGDGHKGGSKPGRKAKAKVGQDETAGEPPLTRREIEADLVGMGEDFDPAADLADLRKQRDEARAILEA
jgi:hypothetical protein